MIKFYDFYQNPVGKGSGNVGVRYLLHDLYREKTIKLDKNRSIELKAYKAKDDYILHFKIQSETYNQIKYDVVFLLSPIEDEDITERSFDDYELKLISNIPSYAYTYLYVINESKSSIEELHNKFDKIFFTKKPEVRNPQETKGFEKSIHIALNYMRINNYHFKYEIDKILEKENDIKKIYKIINEDFLSFDKIMYQYSMAKKKEQEENKKKKEMLRKEKLTNNKNTEKSVSKVRNISIKPLVKSNQFKSVLKPKDK
jgi:hypothetical protein